MFCEQFGQADEVGDGLLTQRHRLVETRVMIRPLRTPQNILHRIGLDWIESDWRKKARKALLNDILE